MNNGHTTKCRCNRIARLSKEALERMRFELGRAQANGLKRVTGEFECDECGGTYRVSAKPAKIISEK